ncbi:hypothetical protein L596_019859 [Steinernema carpocapsae]|uniref:Uncharacterized protein n=1 Tax=Steinernema carpocapsae TaxID=34508 RepID=A0A4U5MSE7_STECR|nr:hypothetical protein L596_019859 [Steinernema carpocapsae]
MPDDSDLCSSARVTLPTSSIVNGLFRYRSIASVVDVYFRSDDQQNSFDLSYFHVPTLLRFLNQLFGLKIGFARITRSFSTAVCLTCD